MSSCSKISKFETFVLNPNYHHSILHYVSCSGSVHPGPTGGSNKRHQDSILPVKVREPPSNKALAALKSAKCRSILSAREKSDTPPRILTACPGKTMLGRLLLGSKRFRGDVKLPGRKACDILRLLKKTNLFEFESDSIENTSSECLQVNKGNHPNL